MIKLSVCITTYNRAKRLNETLASLRQQTRQPDQLVISDDCSHDGTGEVVASWQARFRNFVSHRNESNLNMPGNLNRAISLCNGEYVANLHDADTFDPTLIEKWEAALDQHPTAGFAFCGLRIPEQQKDYLEEGVEPFTPGREFFERHQIHRYGSRVWGTVMARRTSYQKLGPFDPQLGFISDVDMWFRMFQHFDVCYIKEPLIYLDNEMTESRRFTWWKLFVANRIMVANIRRFYAYDTPRLEAALRKQKHVMKAMFLRWLAGRVWRRDMPNLWRGLVYAVPVLTAPYDLDC